MTFPFAWNEFADQPHNVAPRRERLRHHVRHAGGYIGLIAQNLALAAPVLKRYWKLRRAMHRTAVELGGPFAVSCSPAGDRNEDIVACLKDAGVRRTLVRIPSWEHRTLGRHEAFARLLRSEGLDVTAALLQRRDDVLDLPSWQAFAGDVFSALSPHCSFFELGHAWNRTKWGVWDHKEYISLAQAAVPLAEKYGVRLVGPAIIDFEFHLYPPTLRAVPFDKVSSLLYVDRTGAPENAQFGWTTAKKIALWRAVVDCSLSGTKDCWITEMNWPIAGTGEYSPAPGKPSVTEEEQADYLVRYFIIAAASGLVERIYWWQLVAPGYGLIDSRDTPWRKRPSYFAFRNLIRRLEGSRFEGKINDRRVEIFLFRKEGEEFAVGWTRTGAVDYTFHRTPKLVIGRDGEERRPAGARIRFEEKPQYVFFG
jgi:hypothetical protein